MRDYSHLEDQDPFFGYPHLANSRPPKKLVQVTVFQNTDVDTNPPLYFCKSETSSSQISLSSENKALDVKIKIRGFVSNKLQKRLIEDFNSWARNWINKTGGVFLKYISLKDKKQSYMPTEVAIEAIERLIWHYTVNFGTGR